MTNSNRPIAVGDMVYAATTCCSTQMSLAAGRIRQVAEIRRHITKCEYCGHFDRGLHAFSVVSKHGAPTWWLKRIPPIDEPAETYTVEKHKEPA